MPVFLELKCKITKKLFNREINPLSEFYTNGENFRIREIADWITKRGNPQHNTKLELVSYSILKHKNTQ